MGRWLGSVFEAARLAKGIFALIVAVWCVLPVMVEWVLHPSDVIRLVHYLEGEAIPLDFSGQELWAGEFFASVAFAMLGLLLLVALTVLYRRTQFSVVLYPAALILVGVVGNGLWGYGFHFFDLAGTIVGLFPTAATVILQGLIERQSQDFVFGPGNRPQFEGEAFGAGPWS